MAKIAQIDNLCLFRRVHCTMRFRWWRIGIRVLDLVRMQTAEKWRQMGTEIISQWDNKQRQRNSVCSFNPFSFKWLHYWEGSPKLKQDQTVKYTSTRILSSPNPNLGMQLLAWTEEKTLDSTLESTQKTCRCGAPTLNVLESVFHQLEWQHCRLSICMFWLSFTIRSKSKY